MIRPSCLFLPLAAALLLPGCSATGDYPSLAHRDVERISGTAEAAEAVPAPAPPMAPADAGTEAQIASLVARARAAHQRFLGERRGTERLVAQAGGAAKGTENWSVAISALSALESARNDASQALASIDTLFAAERLAHYEDETGNFQAIAAARDTVTGWVDEENRTIEALARRLGA